MKQVAHYVKDNGGTTRLDTDGHGNIINHRNILPELRGLVDAVSISLNSINPKEYQKLMGTENDKQWEAMVEFAKAAKEFISDVYMSTVGIDGIDIEATKNFVEEKIGAKFRFRPMF